MIILCNGIAGFYDLGPNNATLDQPKVKTLSRTFAQTVSGTIESMSFTSANATFVLRYKYRNIANNGAATTIYLNQAWYYSNGFQVAIKPSKAAQPKVVGPNTIQIKENISVIKEGSIITVTITPK